MTQRSFKLIYLFISSDGANLDGGISADPDHASLALLFPTSIALTAHFSDLQNATSRDPVLRRALATEIRTACINVGFFYGRFSLVDPNLSLTGPVSQKPWHTRNCDTDCRQQCKAILCAPDRGKDQGGSCALSLSSRSTGHQLDIHRTPHFKGYTALLGENTNPNNVGDLHEGFDIGWESISYDRDMPAYESGPMTGENVWPEHLPCFREDLLTY